MSELKAKKILEYWYNMECFAPFFPTKRDGDSVLYGIVQEELPWSFGKENEIFNAYIGKLNVDDLKSKLYNAMELEEAVERENSVTCVCKLKFNNNGDYVRDSFKVNTFLFAVTSLISAKTFDTTMNKELVDNFNIKIDSILASSFLKVTNKDKLIEIEDLILSQLDYLNEESFYCLVRPEADNKDDAEENMLDSFFAEDISMVLQNLKSNDKIINFITAKDQKDTEKIKIDRDIEAMKKWTFPDKYPMGKWPSTNSPNLMEQIAINIAISEAEEVKNIFSVNSPPGTGKTTLLKEMIANNVVNRAAELSKYEDPNDALKMCKVKNPPDDFHKTYYEFPSELEKYSILVASNNDSALENIFLDLPNAYDTTDNKTHTGDFDADILGEVYFSDVATKLTGKKAWGLISASLQNDLDIKQVKRVLNTNKNQLFGSYFNDELKKVDWNIAKEGFIKQYNIVKIYQAGIINDAYKLYESYDKKAELESLEAEAIGLRKEIVENHHTLNDISINEKHNLKETKTVEESITGIYNSLSFFKKLFLKFSKKSEIKQNLNALNEAKEKLLSEFSQMQELKASSSKKLSKAEADLKANEEKYSSLQVEYAKVSKEVALIKDKYKTNNSDNFADKEFFKDIISNSMSQKACPWTNDKYDELREELFFRALILQKAFIQNAKGVKQNIRMLSKAWESKGFLEKDKQEFFKHVFHTLFLIIPVVSTTINSVSNVLKYIGKEELGTLIVDEAGELSPGSVIGALWRTRKAIIVGDPLQVEPDFTSSNDLARLFTNNLGINPDYAHKEMSVQELANLANPFSGEINGVQVGCPLVVQNRSVSPMFDISNKVSYGDRLFNETKLPREDINLSISLSRWIHCKGEENGNKDHYVKEQGERVVKFVLNVYRCYGPRMFETGANMIFIISPFTSVVNCIKARLKGEFSLNKIFNIVDPKYLDEWLENAIGTVQKFQGKEANEVIFVLGCDEKSGKMAANWAANKVNILNAAVTRAKYRLVVVGDAELWSNVQNFDEAFNILQENYEEFRLKRSKELFLAAQNQ